jgi:hypothetical protein
MIPAESNATTGGRRPGIPRGTRLLLVGLALVFVMGSAGFLYTSIAKQRTIDSAHATATAHTMLTGTHAAATAVIATVQAESTSTAIAATATTTALQVGVIAPTATVKSALWPSLITVIQLR